MKAIKRKNVYQDYFEKTDIQKLQEEIIERLLKVKEDAIKDALRIYVNPPIKGEITKGKLTWRGLRLVEDFSNNTFWIEQRGIIVTPIYKLQTL
jgi:uncharacterized Fe-S cluster-containing radical SAM superfamily protein